MFLFKSKDSPFFSWRLPYAELQDIATRLSLCCQNLVWRVCPSPAQSQVFWSHFLVLLAGSCGGKYGSWKWCFQERLQLASSSACSHAEIYAFYLGTYQGKQSLVSGRKTAFVPRLIHVQIRHLCLRTGWVVRDRSNFTCLTATNLSEAWRECWCLGKELYGRI